MLWCRLINPININEKCVVPICKPWAEIPYCPSKILLYNLNIELLHLKHILTWKVSKFNVYSALIKLIATKYNCFSNVLQKHQSLLCFCSLKETSKITLMYFAQSYSLHCKNHKVGQVCKYCIVRCSNQISKQTNWIEAGRIPDLEEKKIRA